MNGVVWVQFIINLSYHWSYIEIVVKQSVLRICEILNVEDPDLSLKTNKALLFNLHLSFLKNIPLRINNSVIKVAFTFMNDHLNE